jgi:L-threonylcarbamoyladenylate synthase
MSNSLSPTIALLQAGKIIAYPTESVYGLGCDPLNEAAVLQLLALKKRALHKGLILIAADITQILPYIEITQVLQARWAEIQAHWPGPVTWVFPASEHVPPWICGDHRTVAVRVTAHPVANQLCAQWGRPLVSTSANLAQQLPAKTAEAVQAIFPATQVTVVPGQVGGLDKPTEIRDAMSGLVIRA